MNFVKRIIKVLIPFYSSYVKSVSSGVHNQSYWNYVRFRLTGNCSKAGYYPVHPTCTIANARKVYVGCNATIARPGCYIQGAGTVYLETMFNSGRMWESLVQTMIFMIKGNIMRHR